MLAPCARRTTPRDCDSGESSPSRVRVDVVEEVAQAARARAAAVVVLADLEARAQETRGGARAARPSLRARDPVTASPRGTPSITTGVLVASEARGELVGRERLRRPNRDCDVAHARARAHVQSSPPPRVVAGARRRAPGPRGRGRWRRRASAMTSCHVRSGLACPDAAWPVIWAMMKLSGSESAVDARFRVDISDLRVGGVEPVRTSTLRAPVRPALARVPGERARRTTAHALRRRNSSQRRRRAPNRSGAVPSALPRTSRSSSSGRCQDGARAIAARARARQAWNARATAASVVRRGGACGHARPPRLARRSADLSSDDLRARRPRLGRRRRRGCGCSSSSSRRRSSSTRRSACSARSASSSCAVRAGRALPRARACRAARPRALSRRNPEPSPLARPGAVDHVTVLLYCWHSNTTPRCRRRVLHRDELRRARRDVRYYMRWRSRSSPRGCRPSSSRSSSSRSGRRRAPSAAAMRAHARDPAGARTCTSEPGRGRGTRARVASAGGGDGGCRVRARAPLSRGGASVHVRR